MTIAKDEIKKEKQMAVKWIYLVSQSTLCLFFQQQFEALYLCLNQPVENWVVIENTCDLYHLHGFLYFNQG